MKQFLKVFLMLWLSVVGAFLVSNYLLPASASTMLEYQALYTEMVAEPEVDPEKKERLDRLLQELNQKDNIVEDQLGYLAKNVLFFVLMAPFMFWLARRSGLTDNAILIAAGLIFLPFIFVNFFITGAILASAFVVGGIAFRYKPEQQTADATDSE
ncbi:MAG: hypothetical protein L3J62_00750 [Gammaproteobacteria bacterium]|nr:hypothetical protein [Gammaproteobacteria bacterium]MCF6229311.1 hypothetical protein [Gammaproteobacteria bacterium]